MTNVSLILVLVRLPAIFSCFTTGVLLLDFEARDLTAVVYRVVEELYIDGVLDSEERKSELLRVLLYRYLIQI